MEYELMKCLLIIPAYNEAENIEKVIENIDRIIEYCNSSDEYKSPYTEIPKLSDTKGIFI